MTEYLVAAIHPWNAVEFQRHVKRFPGRWHLITERDALTSAAVDEIRPRYLFFPHWSWLVPNTILNATERTDRCLINLPSLEMQIEAVTKLATILEPGGKLVLIESVQQGQERLNSLRETVGLDPVPYHLHGYLVEVRKVIGDLTLWREFGIEHP